MSSGWVNAIIFDLNLAEIQKSNPKIDEEKIHIEPSDLIFINNRGEKANVHAENIFITKENDLNHIYMAINLQSMLNLNVKSFILFKLGIFVEVFDTINLIKNEINY